jgi:hypothetical protein
MSGTDSLSAEFGESVDPMRASKNLLDNVERELAQCADRTGAAFLREYNVAVERMERFVSEMNYSETVMNRVADCSRRLKNWYEAKVRERTEFVERKKEK